MCSYLCRVTKKGRLCLIGLRERHPVGIREAKEQNL